MSRRPEKPAPVVVKRPADQRRKLPPELEAFARSDDEKLRIKRPYVDRGRVRDPREGYTIPGVANRDARAVYDVRSEAMRALWRDGEADEQALAELGELLHDAIRLELWDARRLTGFEAFAEEVVGVPAERAHKLVEAAAMRNREPVAQLTEREIALWLRTEAGLYEGDESARARVRTGPNGPRLEITVDLAEASTALAGVGARHLPLARGPRVGDERPPARAHHERGRDDERFRPRDDERPRARHEQRAPLEQRGASARGADEELPVSERGFASEERESDDLEGPHGLASEHGADQGDPDGRELDESASHEGTSDESDSDESDSDESESDESDSDESDSDESESDESEPDVVAHLGESDDADELMIDLEDRGEPLGEDDGEGVPEGGSTSSEQERTATPQRVNPAAAAGARLLTRQRPRDDARAPASGTPSDAPVKRWGQREPRNDGGPRGRDERPRFDRDGHGRDERPRFGGGTQRDERPGPSGAGGDRPRFGGGGGDRPRFDRGGSAGGDRPRFAGGSGGGGAGDRPRFDRGGSAGGDRPRFGGGGGSDRPRFDRGGSAGGDRPRFGGGGGSDRPRFDRGGSAGGDRPRFGGGGGGASGDRPRFDRGGGASGDRPRFGGGGAGGDRPRFGGGGAGGDRPRFDRGGSGGGRDDRPRFGGAKSGAKFGQSGDKFGAGAGKAPRPGGFIEGPAKPAAGKGFGARKPLANDGAQSAQAPGEKRGPRRDDDFEE